MPRTNDKITLSRIINKFSDCYNTPKFEPHITILGGFLAKETESIKNLKFLSKKIPPFEIQFGKVSYMNEYFRSIFIEVMLSDKLKELLNEQGYPVARRTVAKYREQLHVPVARLRKQI